MTAHFAADKLVPDAWTGKAWGRHLAMLAVVAGALLLLFVRDAAAMVRIWFESSTYNHCALILPLIGWLVWQRLPELRQLVPQTWVPGLAVIALGAAGWLLGEAGGVALVRHASLVLMLQGAVIACLGKAAARGLAFPLLYAFFLVPAGDEILPLMQTLTARMCMALLGLAGIPAHIEGVFISTPAGNFEVAEACSGVKFLVAMLAYGVLVANLCFRSWPRRIQFVGVSIVVPIVANGVRAWGTIYVATLTSIDFAAGFDHVLYGWIFFAIVIAVTMAIGWRFFDRPAGAPWFDPKRLQPKAPRREPRARLAAVAGAALLLGIAPLGWSAAMAARGSAPVPAALAMPAVPGWQAVGVHETPPWQPHFAGADRIRLAHYRDARGRVVEVAIVWFARQGDGREIVGFGQGPAAPGGRWAWTAEGAAPPAGRLDRIVSFGSIREVASFYRIGQIVTGNPVQVKVETMKARLLGGPQRAAALLVSAQSPGDGVSPRPAIDDFLAALGPVDRAIDRAGEGR